MKDDRSSSVQSSPETLTERHFNISRLSRGIRWRVQWQTVVLLVACIVATTSASAAGRRRASQSTAKPALSQAPVPSEAAGPIANPSRTVRGGIVFVSVAGAPKDVNTAQLSLDGHLVPAAKTDTSGTFSVVIPESDGARDPNFIALGKHRIALVVDGRWFTGDNSLTIDSDSPHPVLTSVSPAYLVRGSNGTLTLTGSHFIASSPFDNEILFDSLPQPVAWDGCDSAHPRIGMDADKTHGAIEQDGTAIVLCNVKPPVKASVEVNIRQGVYQTDSHLRISISSWARWQVLGASVAVLILCFAVVLGLAHFGARYSIGDQQYGAWEVLFLDLETDTYSLSKLQFYLWTSAAVLTYTYLVIGRYFVQGGAFPDVPSSLPGILAVGAGTAIGSQFVTNVRGPKGSGQEKPNLSDFVTSGGVAAPDRVQMLVWTMVGVTGFCTATFYTAPWQIQDLPKIGDSLMLLMGISSAGYLGGKLARKPGPVLSEIALTPSGPDDSPGAEARPAAKADLTEPIAAAQQVYQKASALLAHPAQGLSAAQLNVAHDAVFALKTALDYATQQAPGHLSSIAGIGSATDSASRLLAMEFRDLEAQNAEASEVEAVRQHAEVAQEIAHAIQGLATGASQAMGAAQVLEKDELVPRPTRTIELRGRNLSPDATFEINNLELPFRMLMTRQGITAPEVVAAESDRGAGMAKALRLTIDFGALSPPDRERYESWFRSGGKDLKFTIYNPDGQKSELTFKLPPGEQLAHSTAVQPHA